MNILPSVASIENAILALTAAKHLPLHLLAHTRPDGDAIGSVLGLGLGLRSLGYNVTMIMDEHDQVAAANGLAVEHLAAVGTVLPDDGLRILLDCGHPNRAQDPQWHDAGLWMLIDHHDGNSGGAKWDVVLADASSSCEIVWRILRGLQCDFTNTEVSQALWTGLQTDTGGFQFEKASGICHLMAADLLDSGLNAQIEYERMYGNQDASRLHLQGEMLSRMKWSPDGSICAIILDCEQRQRFGDGVISASDGLLKQLLLTKGVKIAMAIKRDEDDSQWNVSLRSPSGSVDVSALASVFGGGGHIRAAGLRMTDEPQVFIDTVYGLIPNLVCR